MDKADGGEAKRRRMSLNPNPKEPLYTGYPVVTSRCCEGKQGCTARPASLRRVRMHGRISGKAEVKRHLVRRNRNFFLADATTRGPVLRPQKGQGSKCVSPAVGASSSAALASSRVKEAYQSSALEHAPRQVGAKAKAEPAWIPFMPASGLRWATKRRRTEPLLSPNSDGSLLRNCPPSAGSPAIFKVQTDPSRAVGVGMRLPHPGGNQNVTATCEHVVAEYKLTLPALPLDVLHTFCCYLDHRALVSFGECCRPLHALTNSNDVWRLFCTRVRPWISATQVEAWGTTEKDVRLLARRLARIDSLLERWLEWKKGRDGELLPVASGLLTSKQGERLYLLCLSHGAAAALTQIGVWYHLGEGLAQDDFKAVSLFRMAAEQGHPRACLNLGICYFRGWGVGEDRVEGLRWAHQADKGGETHAKYYFGMFNILASREDCLNESARQDLLAGAEGGDVRAQMTLGYYLRSGSPGEQDLPKAIHYLRMAVNSPRDDGQDGSGGADHVGMRKDKGRSKFAAAHVLGRCYDSGQGVPRNTELAALLYAMSAAGGWSQGKMGLSRYLEAGLGVVRDLEESQRLWRLADSQAENYAPICV
eukprot:TRINITY_DN472_c0_g11_i1.p1 TRINITY_DN472_c0_g11~~TRINITY_DN472_c0_g11_i1.p1  ORF type:complete len:591 (+),score=34.27 TRINITY_DN472_c0_g11_i1:1543-3315(+)